MDIPAGERRVWLARTANPWLSLIAAVAGVVGLAALLIGLSGLTETMWMLIVPLAWPVRRWAAADIGV
ncbi:hypothetical protein MTF65_18360 [Streptomyces sp. APSN-46.1]|nr:hypothetical protein [Streptomyces sp. APSN-46.1]